MLEHSLVHFPPNLTFPQTIQVSNVNGNLWSGALGKGLWDLGGEAISVAGRKTLSTVTSSCPGLNRISENG